MEKITEFHGLSYRGRKILQLENLYLYFIMLGINYLLGDYGFNYFNFTVSQIQYRLRHRLA